MYLDPFILAAAGKVLVGTEKLNGVQITAMTIIGLLVVFSALLILVAFLYGSGSLFKKAKQKPAEKVSAPKPAPAKAAPAPVKKAAPAPAPAAAADDDAEVIAVIMAAIAAMGAAEGKQYRLRSVKQVTRGGSGRSAWAQAGIIDATRPF